MENYRTAFSESVSAAREELTEGMAVRFEDVKSGVEARLETLKNMLLTKPTEYVESVKEEFLELKTRYAVNLADRNRLGRIKDFFQRDMIRSNPGMTSVEFSESLEELKKKAAEKKEKKKEED